MNKTETILFTKFFDVNREDDNNYQANTYLSLKNDTIYQKGIYNYEVARIIDNVVFIVFSLKNKKTISKLFKYCLLNNIDMNNFIYVENLYPEKDNIEEYDYHRDNYYHIFDNYIKYEMFYLLKKYNIEISDIILTYTNHYKTFSTFNEFYNKKNYKGESIFECKYTGMEYKNDYWYSYGKSPNMDYIITNSDIRESLTNILRKIKIKRALLDE